jgi:Methane oxygenase PmoA
MAKLQLALKQKEGASMIRIKSLGICITVLLGYSLGWAQSGIAEPIAVPRMQAIPMPDAEVSFQRDGEEIARYHFGPSSRRPFVFPLVGPSGRSLTRMGHPHDPIGHSHHQSFWISHNDVNGVSFWADQGKGRIVHQRILGFTDSDAEAAVLVLNTWIDDSNGKTLLTERRRIAVRPLQKGEWLLILDLQLEAKEDVTLGKTPFGLIGVRMAKSIGVNDGGGTIRNSAGGVDEKGAFWKPAKWVDYSGAIKGRHTEGITLLDHPANPNHPSVFHVRNDGWMGASLTFDGARKIEPGHPLRLRYGLFVHAGMPSAEAIEERWAEFAKTKVEELTPKKK